MARKNKFEKTKYSGIYACENADGKIEYFATFMLDGIYYQKKNLTKMYGSKTAKKASDALSEVKTDLRNGKDPFDGRSTGEKVRDIVLASIEAKKPKKAAKDNSKYKRNLTSFYLNHIDPVIGHLKMSKVKREHTLKILASIEDKTKSYKKYLNVLMFKIFEDEFRAGKIKTNPFYDLNYGEHTVKPNFDIRLNETMENVAKKLYQTALNHPTSHRLIILMSIMLARRIGELHKLKFSHINRFVDGSYYVTTSEDITKSGVVEKYPLPQEVVELLPDEILDSTEGNNMLFNFSYSTVFNQYNAMVKKADLQVNEGYKITSHDNRNLFLSILASQGHDSDLVDRCLSHSNIKEIKQTYLNVLYEKRQKIFKEWWEFLRAPNEDFSI